MKCKGCGEELGEYCSDCQENMLSEAIHEANKARQKNSKKYKLVPMEVKE